MTLSKQLAKIKERTDAATEGPWHLRNQSSLTGRNEYWILFEEFSSLASIRNGADDPEYTSVKGNAEFIAASRTDIPRLVAAIEYFTRQYKSFRCACEPGRAYGPRVYMWFLSGYH